MLLKVVGSSSAGNCYILEAYDGEVLIIECGVSFRAIKEALNFKLSGVSSLLITHNHLDHCKAVNDVLKAGIPVFASAGTHEAMGTSKHHRAALLVSGRRQYVGRDFKVLPFDVKHDAAEPLGFLIHHHECGTVLFLTDSYYSPYTFRGLNNIIIEANYCQTILDKRLADGENPQFLRDRVITSHLSLASCKELLQANDLSGVNNILLIHLSDGNSDAKRFQREVQEATGKRVYVAEPGLTIPFTKKPF